MDRLDEIQRRLQELEAGLVELKALVEEERRPGANQPAVATPPAPRPAPSFWTQARAAAKAPPIAPPPSASAPPPPSASAPQPPSASAPQPPSASAAPPPRAPGATPPASSPRTPAGTEAPAPVSGLSTRKAGEFEANLLGSWFARAGAVAIFLGAVFAFKYAVDNNLISPAGRVLIGLLTGLAFVGWGEWAHRKSWPLFAQAVAGVGVAIGYLSIWAGYQLYDLMSPTPALLLLGLLVIAGGALAVRHNSISLAVLAALGGFLNPVLVSTGRGSELALYSYLLVLDLGIAGLAWFKKWRPLTAVALVATWFLVFGVTLGTDGSPRKVVELAFATAFLLLFHTVSLHEPVIGARRSDEADLALFGLNAAAYFFFGTMVLDGGPETAFALVAGLVHVAAALAFRERPDPDNNLISALALVGVAFVTISADLQFDGPLLSAVWGIEAMVLAAAGTRKGLSKLYLSAATVFGLSVATSLSSYDLGFNYEPATPLVSLESLPFVVQILGLTLAALFLRRRANDPNSKLGADAAAVLANSMALLWFSFELWAAFNRSDTWSAEGFTFTLSSLWTVYASALLGFGIARRARWARLMAVAVFGLVILKLILADVWLLETPLRIAAFIGLGFVLLGCSVGYHRFRALILGPDEPAPLAG